MIIIALYRDGLSLKFKSSLLRGNYKALRTHKYSVLKAARQALVDSWRGYMVLNRGTPYRLLDNFGIKIDQQEGGDK